MKDLTNEYIVKTTEIKKGEGHWDYLKCDIVQRKFYDEDNWSENIIGSYKRNYSSLFNTFHPFEQDGKHYALYSKDYTTTRVMSLPDCKDLGGEEEDQYGFCPVDFYVPVPDEGEVKDTENFDTSDYGKFGFVAGCVWGDDSDWKVELLDLRNISKGEIIRKRPFGYMPMFGNRIKDNINMTWFVGKGEFADTKEREISIATSSPTFELDENFDLKYKRGGYDDIHLSFPRKCKCGESFDSIMTREIGEPHDINYKELIPYQSYFKAVGIEDQALELRTYCYKCKTGLVLKGKIENGIIVMNNRFER